MASGRSESESNCIHITFHLIACKCIDHHDRDVNAAAHGHRRGHAASPHATDRSTRRRRSHQLQLPTTRCDAQIAQTINVTAFPIATGDLCTTRCTAARCESPRRQTRGAVNTRALTDDEPPRATRRDAPRVHCVTAHAVALIQPVEVKFALYTLLFNLLQGIHVYTAMRDACSPPVLCAHAARRRRAARPLAPLSPAATATRDATRTPTRVCNAQFSRTQQASVRLCACACVCCHAMRSTRGANQCAPPQRNVASRAPRRRLSPRRVAARRTAPARQERVAPPRSHNSLSFARTEISPCVVSTVLTCTMHDAWRDAKR